MITSLTEPVLMAETSAVDEALPKSSLMFISSVGEYKIPSLSTVTWSTIFKIVNSWMTFLVEEILVTFSPTIKSPSLKEIVNSYKLKMEHTSYVNLGSYVISYVR